MAERRDRLVRWGALALLALAIPIALVGTGAVADVFDSEVSIRYNDDNGVFKGRVDSTPECEGDRRVVLFKARPGDDKRVGSDVTNRRGKWRIEKNHANGTYYVKVKPTTLPGYDSAPGDRCAGDRSRRIDV